MSKPRVQNIEWKSRVVMVKPPTGKEKTPIYLTPPVEAPIWAALSKYGKIFDVQYRRFHSGWSAVFVTFMNEESALATLKQLSETKQGVLRLDGDTRKFTVLALDANRLAQYRPRCAVSEMDKCVEDSLNSLVNGATQSTSPTTFPSHPSSPFFIQDKGATIPSSLTSQRVKIDRTRRVSQQEPASVTTAAPSFPATSSSSKLTPPGPYTVPMPDDSTGYTALKDTPAPSLRDRLMIGQIPLSNEAMDLDSNETSAKPDIAALMRGEFLIPLPDDTSKAAPPQSQSTSVMELDQPSSLPKKPVPLPNADIILPPRSTSIAEAMSLPVVSAPPRLPPTAPKSLTKPPKRYVQSDVALRAEITHLTGALARAEAQLKEKEKEKERARPPSPSSSRKHTVHYWKDEAEKERKKRHKLEDQLESLESEFRDADRAYRKERDLRDRFEEEMERAKRRAQSKHLASTSSSAPKSRRIDAKSIDVDMLMLKDEKARFMTLEKSIEDLTAGLVKLDAQLAAETEAEAKLIQERGRVKAEIVALKFRMEAYSKLMTPGLREALSVLDSVSNNIAQRVAGQSALGLDTQNQSSSGSPLPLKRTYDVTVE